MKILEKMEKLMKELKKKLRFSTWERLTTPVLNRKKLSQKFTGDTSFTIPNTKTKKSPTKKFFKKPRKKSKFEKEKFSSNSEKVFLEISEVEKSKIQFEECEDLSKYLEYGKEERDGVAIEESYDMIVGAALRFLLCKSFNFIRQRTRTGSFGPKSLTSSGLFHQDQD